MFLDALQLLARSDVVLQFSFFQLCWVKVLGGSARNET
jgi:hypothetical protein